MITSSSGSSQSVGKSGLNGRVQTPEKRAEATIERLQREIVRVLEPELDGVRSLALVDFPDHTNVGDSAIYLGELEWLQRRHGLVPRYAAT
jgi:exopolysaccharide biosynthesis predicted pyruvyltransferase EpsI